MEQMREKVINELQVALERGILTADEVRALLAPAAEQSGSSIMRKSLVAIGGVLAATGLAVLTGQHWNEFPSIVRVMLTLGSGLVALGAGTVLHLERTTKAFAAAFYALALLLIPGGVVATAYELGFPVTLESTNVVMAMATALIFAVPVFLCGSNLMLLAVFGAFTWLFFAATQAVLPESRFFSDGDFFRLRSMILGISYLGAAVAFRRSEFERISGPLYFFGSAAVLITGYWYMGWGSDVSRVWEILYPALCAAAIYGGVELRSRSLLIHGALALNGYIARISLKYFAMSIGWPFAMIVAGLGMIAVAIYSMGLYREQGGLR